ncbi:MAG: response regulator, partial [Armatimonadetes bacterium]|nr:response regulator [Armatimonadota bacterium]
MCVNLIEDDNQVVKTLQASLQAAGYMTRTASDAPGARALWATGQRDDWFVVDDRLWEEQVGADLVVEWLKEQESNQISVPRIAFYSVSARRLKARLIKAGLPADYILPKGVKHDADVVRLIETDSLVGIRLAVNADLRSLQLSTQARTLWEYKDGSYLLELPASERDRLLQSGLREVYEIPTEDMNCARGPVRTTRERITRDGQVNPYHPDYRSLQGLQPSGGPFLLQYAGPPELCWED